MAAILVAAHTVLLYLNPDLLVDGAIQEDTVRMLYHVHVEQKIEREQVAKVTGTNKDDSAGPKKPVQRKEDKVYPNDPCPCGSGKKYKQCCGRKAAKI